MFYPKQQWYVAASSDEIGRSLFERRILDEPIVFYRIEAGTPVALAGLCPHRLYPLAHGRRRRSQERGISGRTCHNTGGPNGGSFFLGGRLGCACDDEPNDLTA